MTTGERVMGLGLNEIIIYVMVVFAVLGGLDRIIGNRFGLGEKFEEEQPKENDCIYGCIPAGR